MSDEQNGQRLVIRPGQKAKTLTVSADMETPGGSGGRRGPKPKKANSVRKLVFQMAGVAIPRELFQVILERIRRLRSPEAVPR